MSKQITFKDFDRLNLKSFAESLFQIMEKGIDSPIGDMGEKGGYPISLNAQFGNGKTTFLKMFEHFVKTEKGQEQSYNTIFINAWKLDFYGEPVITILSEFVNHLEQKQKKQQQEKQKKSSSKTNDIIDKAKGAIGVLAQYKLTKVSLNIANQVVQNKIGINLKNVAEVHYSKNNTKSSKEQEQYLSLGKSVFQEFNQREKAIKQVKEIISSYIKTNRLLIIVDELDRARPDYAVHFLEDMKHFFDIENVVFLVAVNKQQMEATVKCLYGQDLDFSGYYRKFFKLEIALPDPYEEAQRLVDDLIKKTNVKYRQDHRGYRVANSYLACKMFQLTLREVEEFVRIFSMILGDRQKAVEWTYQDAYSFFICLFIKEKTVFKRILSEDFTFDDFIQFIDKKGFNFQLNRAQGVHVREIGPKISADNLVWGNYILLGAVACSFIQRQRDEQDISLIQAKFPYQFSSISDVRKCYSYYDSSVSASGNIKADQPAVKFCKKINKYESVFK